MAKKKKIAVVLFNLGGPDAPEAVRPFLLNFFMDQNIIPLPIPFRCFIAAMIANKRSKAEARESYDELGGSSPLLENSRAQAKALEKALKTSAKEGQQFKTFISMRYWHPMAPQIVREVRDWGADHIVFIPLYPQFSTTTTWSSLENWDKHARQAGYMNVPRSMVCCYPTQKGFIEASADHIYQEYQKAVKDGHGDNMRVLFSAHGLPESVVKKGDPYQWQCEKSAQLIAQHLENKHGLAGLDWQICYQSRVGPAKWISPSTEEALEQAAKDGKAVLIYPHAFTQEDVETLVELDVESKEVADDLGIDGYYRALTVGTHKAFIDGLAKMVRKQVGVKTLLDDTAGCICPAPFGKCCQRIYEGDSFSNIKPSSADADKAA